MKKLFKLSIFSLIILFTFISNTTFAATGTAPETKAVPIATVNIESSKIISQKENVFDISFKLTNGVGQQSGVKYGVKLVSENKSGQTVVDEKIYDESLVLKENSSIQKEITYTAPKDLSGSYSLFLTSNNTSGFPFSIAFVGKVTLTSSIKGFEIVSSSCYLKIEGDTTNTHYGLLQGVDINKDESLRLTCNTINHSSNALSLTPMFETRYRSSYGEIAPQTGGDTAAISFAASKNENFSILLPKGAKPQLYDLKVTLSNDQIKSNTIDLHYFISGTSATIQNLSLDKDYYKMGETAQLSLIWTKFGDVFLRSKSSTVSPAVISLATIITNSSGMSCAKEASQVLTKNPGEPVTKISVPVTSNCYNPHVSLTLTDGSGNVLDQKDFAFETTNLSDVKPIKASTSLILIIVLIILIIIWLFTKKRRPTITTTTMNMMLFLFVFTAIGGVIPLHKAMAATYPAGINSDIWSAVGLDSGTYAPGGVIKVTTSITSQATISKGVSLKVTLPDVTVGNSIAITIPDQPINPGDTILTNPVYFTAPSAASLYLADFSTGVDEAGGPGGGGNGSPFTTCFVADTKVTLADGTKKNIQDVKIGDVIKGDTTNNTVLAFHRPTLNGKVYSFNGGRYFVTEEHPFKTIDGWKSINPSKTADENIGITVTELKVGDTLVTDHGLVRLNTIDSKVEPATTALYNFALTGDHTYYADGYIVHNKTPCGSQEGWNICYGPGTTSGGICMNPANGLGIFPPGPPTEGFCALTCTPNQYNQYNNCPEIGHFCDTDHYFHNCY